MLLAVHDKHVTLRGQKTDLLGSVLNKIPKGRQPPIAPAAPGNHQAPGPLSLNLQFHGPKMDAEAPGISNPLKLGKYRAEHKNILMAFLPLILLKNPSLRTPAHSPLPLVSQNNAYSLTDHCKEQWNGHGLLKQSPSIPLECQFSPMTSILISINDETIFLQFCFYLKCWGGGTVFLRNKVHC